MWWVPLVTAAIQAQSERMGQEDSQQFAQDQFARNYAMQKEFAQYGIQWRTADAKAAGLHPLFAMGAQVPSGSPVVVNEPYRADYSAAIQNAANAYERFMKKGEVEVTPERKYYLDDPQFGPSGETIPGVKAVTAGEYMEAMQTKAAKLEVDRIAQDIAESKARVAESEFRINKERMLVNPDPGMSDAVEYSPDQVVAPKAGKQWRRAGDHSGWTSYNIDDDFQMLLPSSNSMSESLESMSESKIILASVIAFNVKKFGPGWLGKFRQYFPMFNSAPTAPPSEIPVF